MVKKGAKNKTTIDDLAVMVQNGFAEQKKDLKDFKVEMYDFRDDMLEFVKKTNVTLLNLDTHAEQTNKRLDAIEKTLGPLVQVSGLMQKEITSLNIRVDRLEKKIGLGA